MTSFFSTLQISKEFLLLTQLKARTKKGRKFWDRRFLASLMLCSKALERGSPEDAELARDNPENVNIQCVSLPEGGSCNMF